MLSQKHILTHPQALTWQRVDRDHHVEVTITLDITECHACRISVGQDVPTPLRGPVYEASFLIDPQLTHRQLRVTGNHR
ncbi:MAG: hypothetical protein ACPGGB_04090, partial [Flavobacteriales bacterium]